MARVTNDIVFNETNRNRILDWVIDVTGSSRIQEPLEDYFKDGVLLCQYVFSYLCFDSILLSKCPDELRNPASLIAFVSLFF